MNSPRENKNQELKKLGIEVIDFDSEKIANEHKKDINCRVCTLGLYKSKKYLDHNCKTNCCYCPKINSDFMQELIDQVTMDEKIKKLDSPEPGCMVLYFKKGELCQSISHSGLIIKNNPLIIESKWGSHPDLLRHDLWKVPDSYGSLDSQYYTHPNLEDVDEFYLQKTLKALEILLS